MILYIDCEGENEKETNTIKDVVITVLKSNFKNICINYNWIFGTGTCKGIFLYITPDNSYIVIAGAAITFNNIKEIHWTCFLSHFGRYKKILKHQRGPIIQINLSCS